MILRIATIMFGLGAALTALAQGQASFEVASVKPAPPFDPVKFLQTHEAHVGIKIDPAFADFGGLSLTELAAYAFRVKAFQISGPAWMNARFDVLGKLPNGAPADQVPEMVQQLLMDRFHMKSRRENKEFPAFSLVTAPGGPKLRITPENFDHDTSPGLISVTVDRFAEMIACFFDKPLLNNTNLPGHYLLTYEQLNGGYGCLRQISERSLALKAGELTAITPVDTAPLMKILADLGLKVEPHKLALSAIVIEAIDKAPSEQ